MRYLAIPVIAAAVSFSCFAGCGDDTAGTGGSVGGSCAPGEGCPAAKTDCIGLVDNSGQTKFALRIGHLTLSAPPALANDAVITGLLNNGIAMNLGSCKAETGDNLFAAAASNDAAAGAFSWILQFDTSTGKLTTGGAYPQDDPTAGYCFVNETIQTFAIAPFEVDAPIQGGKFSTSEGKDVVVPVYSDRMRTNVILLPLRGVNIHDATITADNNCLGTFNKDGLLPNNLCLAQEGIPQFIDGATLDGFVELEQADSVEIEQIKVMGMPKSLCAVLAGEAGPKCARDGNNKITFQGDTCSTGSGCADSVKLAATFSASSVALKSSCP